MNDYLKEVRSDILFCLRKISDKLYYTKGDFSKECDNFFAEMDRVFDSYGLDDIEKLFEVGYGFGPYDENDNNKIPFYVYMDIIIETLKQQGKSSNDKNHINELVEKFKILREKTKDFSKDKRFDPEKHIYGDTVKKLITSRGVLSIYKNKEYPSLLMISFKTKIEQFRQRMNGEYEPTGSFDYNSSNFFYNEDESEYRRLLQEKYDELKDVYSQVFAKFFEGGILPEYRFVEEKLIDKNISLAIIDTFKQLSLSRRDYDLTPVGELEWMKANLVSIKFIKRQMEKEVDEEKEVVDEEEEKLQVVEVRDNPTVIKRSKREILKEMLGLAKEFIGISQTKDDSKKRK